MGSLSAAGPVALVASSASSRPVASTSVSSGSATTPSGAEPSGRSGFGVVVVAVGVLGKVPEGEAESGKYSGSGGVVVDAP